MKESYNGSNHQIVESNVSNMENKLNSIRKKIELERGEIDSEFADTLFSFLSDRFIGLSLLLKKTPLKHWRD